MTDREKVVKLATDVMGWKDFGKNVSDDSPLWKLWDPLESICDAYEMESKIPVALRDEYTRALWGLFADTKTQLWRSKFDGYWYFTHATARQRCEAAISALEAQCQK